MKNELLRQLPKVDILLEEEMVKKHLGKNSRELVVSALRESINYYRQQILSNEMESLNVKDILDRKINNK